MALVDDEATEVVIGGNSVFSTTGTVEMGDILKDAVWWVKEEEEPSNAE